MVKLMVTLMAKPQVTVAIPNYNYAQYLTQTITSVLNQTFKDYEILVIDNGSTDNSRQVLSEFGTKIKVIYQENRGQAGSRNRAIAEAAGDYIAFLDADDYWLPEKLAKQMPLFNSQVGLVYSGFYKTDQNLKPIDSALPQYTGDVLKFFALQSGAVVLAGESTAVIRKECFAKVGDFDGSLSISSGWDMFRRIAAHYQIAAVAEPLVYYRQHGSNAHRKIEIFENDVVQRIKKMYADASSQPIKALQNQSWMQSYWMLAGSYWQQKQYAKTFLNLVKWLNYWLHSKVS